MTSLIALLFAPAFASANTTLVCNYSYYTAAMATIELVVYDDGEPASSAKISSGGGPAHKESVTPEAKASDEYVHVWISKERPDNEVEMIVYKERRSQGQSVIINHNVPIGKQVWGECSGMPAESIL